MPVAILVAARIERLVREPRDQLVRELDLGVLQLDPVPEVEVRKAPHLVRAVQAVQDQPPSWWQRFKRGWRGTPERTSN